MQYVVNERVLCYHGPVIYEAKILKAEVFDDSNTQTGFLGAHYFVHYKGWKATCVSPQSVPTIFPSSMNMLTNRTPFRTVGMNGCIKTVCLNITMSACKSKKRRMRKCRPRIRSLSRVRRGTRRRPPVPLPEQGGGIFVSGLATLRGSENATMYAVHLVISTILLTDYPRDLRMTVRVNQN